MNWVDGAVLVKPQPETLKDLYGFLADDQPPLSKIRGAGKIAHGKGKQI